MIDGYIKIAPDDTEFYAALTHVITNDPHCNHQHTKQALLWGRVYELGRAFYVNAQWAGDLILMYRYYLANEEDDENECTGQVCKNPD